MFVMIATGMVSATKAPREIPVLPVGLGTCKTMFQSDHKIHVPGREVGSENDGIMKSIQAIVNAVKRFQAARTNPTGDESCCYQALLTITLAPVMMGTMMFCVCLYCFP